MSRVLISGSLAYDRIMDFRGKFRDHFIADKLHSINVSFAVENIVESFGGTSGNIAYSLALLGDEPHIFSAAGKDFERYAAWLIKCKVNADLVRIVENQPTAAAYIMTDMEDNQITAFHFGAGQTPCGNAVSSISPDLAIVSAGNLVDMLDVPAQCRKAGIKFFCDSGQQTTSLSPEQLLQHIEGAEVLFGNDYEIELAQRKVGGDITNLLQRVRTVVVTRGAQGSSVITSAGEEKIQATSAEAFDPTGAGDAYRAGFAKAYLSKLSLKQCAQLGSTIAAYTVEKQGTQSHIFTLDDVRKRYQAAYGETLEI